MKKSYHIHITGQVQGVGFRPYIFNLAKNLKLRGFVSNGPDGVHLEIEGPGNLLSSFLENLKKQPPSLSRIENIEITNIEPKNYESFDITESKEDEIGSVRISPDFAICESCKQELQNKEDRRFQYAFITCTKCGPRYSVIKKLPYDRIRTSMSKFSMCESCDTEYVNPQNRRFFSQTNSCKECGIEMKYFDHQQNEISSQPDEIFKKLNEDIKNQKIIAIKGIGGYLLLCDATHSDVINKLRERKQRPHKPFALLFKDTEHVEKYAWCSKNEKEVLTGPESPILLLSARMGTDLELKAVSPNLNRIGVMIPYAPLLQLIMDRLEIPLVATSGNLSGSPIIYDDETALNELSRFADFILTNNREIVVPQDDSVLQVSHAGQKIFLRRSRGYAPSYFGNHPTLPENWLALGADVKGTFSFTKNKHIYISQFLGNMESIDSREAFEKTLAHLSQVTGLKPKNIMADLHPGYFSNQRVKQSSMDKISFIQHHKAHFGAILMEKDLLKSHEGILGVVWDGTGLGEDNNIWGGEFFSYFNYHFDRVYQMKYVPHILNDKMSREPRISALSFFSIINQSHLIQDKFNNNEWKIYRKQLELETLKTSSMGRLFDAVACLLGLIDKATFEGQAAMYLESLASTIEMRFEPYDVQLYGNQIDTGIILSQIVEELVNGEYKAVIANRFHDTLVEIIKKVAQKGYFKKIAFTGGVFQNKLLVDKIIYQLSSDFTLYFHDEISANDENISFGQLAVAYINTLRKKTKIPEDIIRSGEILDLS